MALLSGHTINWKDRLGGFWARKVLPYVCFGWVHGKKSSRIKVRWYQRAHRLDFFPKGNKPARPSNQLANFPTG